MMPYCTSYCKFLSAWFWGVPQQNKDFAITTYGGDPSLIRYSSKTAEQNLSFYSNDFGVSQSKTRTLPYKTWGSWGIILWALLTVFILLYKLNRLKCVRSLKKWYHTPMTCYTGKPLFVYIDLLCKPRGNLYAPYGHIK